MKLLEQILTWTQDLPAWQQDAARRLFQKTEGLSLDDYTELYALLKARYGLPNPKGLVPVPLTKDHLPSGGDEGEAVTLTAMRDLEHVNRIAPQQNLPFAPTGMTVIYGGNGSGKSGYARVLKRACRARDAEGVLPDASDLAAKGLIPKAVFDLEVGGVPKAVQWSLTGDPPQELGNVAVFDFHCARVYLTSEQEVAYLPYGLDVVESLGNTVLPKLQQRIDQELATINTDRAPVVHLYGDTKVGKMIEALGPKTDPKEITQLASLSDEEQARIDEIAKILTEADPAAKAEQLRLSASRMKELAARVHVVSARVSNNTLNAIKATTQESGDADAAETAAAKILNSGEELLPGTGELPWKIFFEAAQKYSVDTAFPETPFPNTGDGAVCVLCQQPLSDGADRLQRFEKYIQDDVAKTASSKRQDLAKALDEIEKADLSIGIDGALGNELDQLDASLRPQIVAFQKSIEARRTKMVEATKSTAWHEVPAVSANPRNALRVVAAKQYRLARDCQRASDAAKRDAMTKELAEIEARKALLKSEAEVWALLERIKAKTALTSCKDDLKTNAISAKSKELATKAVTEDLKKSIDTEFHALGVGHIKTKLKSRVSRGQMLHQLILDLPTNAKMEQILSEGEQRAIAIGSFLAELSLAGHSDAIVFDDPVSSLDHYRRERVAERLATEAVKRQVIVFTHDVVFLNQLQGECEAVGVVPGLNFLEWIGGHPGGVQNGLPWRHEKYSVQIDQLEKSQKLLEDLPWPTYPDESQQRKMRSKYDRLRATIEKVVQDFVLQGTVKRFIDYIRVDNLKHVVGLTQKETDEICRLHQRCSGVVTAHAEASIKDSPVPTATELGHDIASLRAVIKVIKDRRKIQGTP